MSANPPSHRLVRAAIVWLAVLFVLAAGAPMYTSDAFWQVASGDWFRAHGLAPQPDPFSFTACDQRWVVHEWLVQVVFSWAHAAMGMYGLRLLTAAAAAWMLWQVARLFRQRLGGGDLAAAAGLALFAMTGTMRIQARPELVTIPMLLLFVGTWTRPGAWRVRDGVILVLAQWVWTNAHSVALLGPVLYAVFLVGRCIDAAVAARGGLGADGPQPGDLRRHAVTFGLCLAATVATPTGVHLWEFAWQDKQTVMQYVDDEWAPFRFAFADNPSMPFPAWLAVWLAIATVLTTAIATAAALERERPRLRSPRLPVPSRVLLALALFFGSLLARRFVWLSTLSLLFCAETLWRCARAGAFAGVADRLRAWPRAIAGTVAAATFAVGWVTQDVEHRSVPLAVATADYWRRPAAAMFDLTGVAFLAESGIEGSAVCHYNSGGILSYHLFPRVRVLIDSRIDLYRRAIYLDYLAVLHGRLDQQRVLDRLGADVYYRHWTLPRPIDRAAWIPVFLGPEGEVLLRRGAPSTERNLERARRWHRERGSVPPVDAAAPAPR